MRKANAKIFNVSQYSSLKYFNNYKNYPLLLLFSALRPWPYSTNIAFHRLFSRVGEIYAGIENLCISAKHKTECLCSLKTKPKAK